MGMNAAAGLGVASCWIHRAKEEFESEEGKAILKKLGIEGDYEGIGNLVLGYAASLLGKRRRGKLTTSTEFKYKQTTIICDIPSSFRAVRHFDGVSPLSSPREPHVCPVVGFPGQSDHVAILTKSPRQGPTWGRH